MKRYTLFAGVNGAGKTSLYYAAFENNDVVGKRVNIDEIVRKSGDWTDTRLQMEAGKIAISLIQQYLSEGISFHQETTLAGRSIFRTVRQAKDLGFQIVLYYVGVNSPKIAQQRVEDRVKKGGHGVDAEIIEKRYYKSLNNLKLVLELCDIVNIYDNSGDDFQYIMAIKDKEIQWKSESLPRWLIDVFDKKQDR